MLEQGVNSHNPALDNFEWSDVFDGGPRGAEVRPYFLRLPEIRRFTNDAVFRLMFCGNDLTSIGRLTGGVFKALSLLSFGRFSPFSVVDDKIEFPAYVISGKRALAALLMRLRGAPGYFSGGLILNLLGYQVLRTVSFHLRSSLRRRAIAKSQVASDIELAVREHGYTVIENVLTVSTLAELNRVLDCPEGLQPYKHKEHPCGWYKGTLHIGGERFDTAVSSEASNAVREILSNRNIFDVVERLAGRRIVTTPEVAVFEWKVPEDRVGTSHQFDFEDMLHADVSYPSYKIFLYLNDVTAENGPFVYCPDTHRLTLKRLLFEYVLSIAYYLTNKQPPHSPQPHRFTNWLIQKLGIQATPVTGKANSMVLANVMGFHGRGRFDSTEPRRALFLNFRYLDAKLIY